MTWSLLGGLMPPAVDTAKENKVKSTKNSGDSGNCSEVEEEQNTNRATRLEFKLTQSLLSKVKVNENSADANSGKQAYIDLPRMNFIINGKTISKDFVGQLCDRYNQELQSSKRQVVKHVLIEMFNHAKAEVPDDHILKELVTNCNQAGYDGSLLMQLFPIFFEHNLQLPDANDRKISIICNSQDSLNIQYCPNMPVKELDTNREICRLDAISEFTLKSQNGKVEYEEGKVTLTIPEQLKNYQAEDKSLLDNINEYFKDADNAVVESLEATFSEGPKSFVIDQESLNSDEGLSLVIVPESSVYDLGDMAKLVKEAIDNKNVDTLNTYIDVVQAGVTRVPPEEGLSIVEKILEIISNFTKEQGKAWSCYPTAPIVSKVYAITERLQGYISYEDYNKGINLEKVLNSIITRLSNNEKSSGSKTALSKENSNTVNSTEISTQESVTANNCKGNKENEQQTPYKVIIPTKYKSVSNIIPIAASNNQSENPAPENSDSQQPQENVDRRENIMNNRGGLTGELISNSFEEGEMHSSDQNTKSIEEALSDAIFSLDCKEVRSLVERVKQESNNVERIIGGALKKANETKVGKRDKGSKDKIKKIREFLAEELIAASLVGNYVKITPSSHEAPIIESKESESDSLSSEGDDYSRLESGKYAGTSSGNGSPFEEVAVTSEMPSMATEEAKVNNKQSDNINDDDLTPVSSPVSGDILTSRSDEEESVVITQGSQNDGEHDKAVPEEHQDDALEKDLIDFSSDDDNSLLGDPVPTSTNEISGRTDGTQTSTRQKEDSTPPLVPPTVPVSQKQGDVQPLPTDNENVSSSNRQKDPCPASTSNLTPTPNPIPTSTPAPTPGLTPDLTQDPILTPTLVPTPDPVPSVANNKSEQVNDTQTNGGLPNNSGKNNAIPQNIKSSKLPVIAASALAVAGVVSGVAIAVYLEMLAAGIAVGVCCLVAALIIYCCNRPSSPLESSNVESVDNRKPTAQQTVN